MNKDNLIAEWLEQQRVRLGQSDAQFARHLGLQRSTWSRLKRGLLRPGYRITAAAASRFPQEFPAILTASALLDADDSSRTGNPPA